MKFLPELQPQREKLTKSEAPKEDKELREILMEQAKRQTQEFADATHAYEQMLFTKAQRAGLELNTGDLDELHELTAQVEGAKQTLFDRLLGRIRQTFSIPKRIDGDLAEAERSGAFKEVDAFNQDIAQAPIIQRKPSRVSRKLLLGTAMTLTAATHEPQIESTLKKGEKLVELAYDAAKTALPDVAIRGRLAFQEMTGQMGAGEAGDENGEMESGQEGWKLDRERMEGKNPELKKFLATLPPLTHDRYYSALDVYYARVNFPESSTVFLKNEFIHARMDSDSFHEAESRFFEQVRGVKGRLTEDEKKDVRRVAFELAKQRVRYEPGIADQYSLIMEGKGNCDALAQYIVAGLMTLGDIDSKKMKVQKFDDHVRVVVRNSPDESWTAIDGHTLVPITAEELRGTLLVDVNDMFRSTRGEKNPNKKNRFSGHVTNTLIKWDTLDARSTSRAFLDPSVELVPMDETGEANKTFEEARREVEGGMQYVEIPVTFDQGTIEFNTTDKSKEDTQEEVNEQVAEEEKEIPVSPSESNIAKFLEGNELRGAFNDLTPMKGISVEEVALQTPYPKSKNPETHKIDLSPLKDSPIKRMQLWGLVPTHFEDLSFKTLEAYRTDVADVRFIEKILKEADEMYVFKLEIDLAGTVSAQDLGTFKQEVISGAYKEIMRSLEQKSWKQQERDSYILMSFSFSNARVYLDYDVDQKLWEFSRIDE